MTSNNKALDLGIMITQLSVILAHINLGNKTQKAKAKDEYRKLLPQLQEYISDDRMSEAIMALGIEGEMKHIERAAL